ncbi:MAG: hypothetical protein HYS57_00575 [Parcubacteria group bacterium]|nr:hypothetical protein [Parcubacteria group bacterium]
MPLVVSPKTNPHFKSALQEIFAFRPADEAVRKEIWHSNFKYELFETDLGGIRTFILFTGYSGASLGQALLYEYDRVIRAFDPRPELFYIGSCFATSQSALEPGDLVIATYTDSPDSYEQAVYQTLLLNSMQGGHGADHLLIARALAKAPDATLARIYCRMSPEPVRGFAKAHELNDKHWWWKFAESWGHEHGFDAGEYECASFYACACLIGLPALALLDVKDKRDATMTYRVRSAAQSRDTSKAIAQLVKEIITSR